MEFTTQKIAENFWAIAQKGVRSFLLIGWDKAILVDNVLSGTAVPVGPAPDRFPETVKVYRHGRAQMYFECVERE